MTEMESYWEEREFTLRKISVPKPDTYTHTIRLEGEELKAFSDCMTQSHAVKIKPRARNFTLWTAKGAALHIKITDSPKAWAIYHDMVKVYFGETSPLHHSKWYSQTV